MLQLLLRKLRWHSGQLCRGLEDPHGVLPDMFKYGQYRNRNRNRFDKFLICDSIHVFSLDVLRTLNADIFPKAKCLIMKLFNKKCFACLDPLLKFAKNRSIVFLF